MSCRSRLFAVCLSVVTLSGVLPARAESDGDTPPATSSDESSSSASGPTVHRINYTESSTTSAKENFQCLLPVMGAKQAASLVKQNPNTDFCGVVSDLSQQMQ